MAAIDSAYRNDIQKHLGYFGIFPPNRPVRLGEIGRRKGDEWEKQGTINRWIEPKEKRTPGGPMIFTSNGDVKTNLKVGAADKLGLHAVDLELTFTKKWAIFFQAHSTTILTLGNQQRVNERLLDEYQKKGKDLTIQDEWVGEVVLCDVLTVIVATEAGQQATLSGKAPINVHGVPVGSIDLEEFKVTRSTSGLSVTGPVRGATPLFKLYRVQDSAFKKADVIEVR